MAKTKKDDRVTLPIGRLINQSVFKRDVYTDAKGVEGKPKYKVEMAFNDESDVEAMEDLLFDAAVAEWGDAGEKAFNDGDMILPLKDGDELAKRREDKGKEGTAYKGTTVIRADTMFNANGDEGPGGIRVYGPDLTILDPVTDMDQIYAGSFGRAGVKIGAYEREDPRSGQKIKAFKFYLVAYQKTDDGEKLTSSADHSTLFEPVARQEGEGTTRRRRRKG